MLSDRVIPTTTYSIFFITLLMVVGLFFFIRAATKDRTEILTVVRQTSPQVLEQELTTYFEGRAYKVIAPGSAPGLSQNDAGQNDSGQSEVELSGFVRPSVFLAIFLSLLAAVGALCLALMLASLFPRYGTAFTGLTLLAPLAGWFYWQRAGREERVTFQVSPESGDDVAEQTRLTVTAHRDELLALQQALAKPGR